MKHGRSRHPAAAERRHSFGEPEFWVHAEHEEGRNVLSLYGELDSASAPILEKQIKRLQWSGALAIVIDLSGLDFVDSAGLHVLVRAFNRAPERQLTLHRGSRNVHRVFELTGTHTLLPFVD